MFKFILPLFLICLLMTDASSQGTVLPAPIPTDNVLWSGLRLRDQINPNLSLQIQPFFRFDNDFGGYQNSSIDISLRHSFNKSWYAQVLSRTWFLPDGFKDQQFLWIDVGHKTPLTGLSLMMTNNLRLHYSLINDTKLTKDFIRYKISFTPTTDWKFKPTFAFEPWFQLNGVGDFERYRIEPGFQYAFNSNLSLVVIWRRQNHVIPTFQQNFWVVVMSYAL